MEDLRIQVLTLRTLYDGRGGSIGGIGRNGRVGKDRRVGLNGKVG
jgi:hypothetical protein